MESPNSKFEICYSPFAWISNIWCERIYRKTWALSIRTAHDRRPFLTFKIIMTAKADLSVAQRCSYKSIAVTRVLSCHGNVCGASHCVHIISPISIFMTHKSDRMSHLQLMTSNIAQQTATELEPKRNEYEYEMAVRHLCHRKTIISCTNAATKADQTFSLDGRRARAFTAPHSLHHLHSNGI